MIKMSEEMINNILDMRNDIPNMEDTEKLILLGGLNKILIESWSRVLMTPSEIIKLGRDISTYYANHMGIKTPEELHIEEALSMQREINTMIYTTIVHSDKYSKLENRSMYDLVLETIQQL